MNIMDELRRRHKIACDHYGTERVLGTFLYGSQNYKLDTVDSDIDTISIIIPSLEEIIFMHQPLSFCNHNPSNKNQTTYKDLRLFLFELRRAGFSVMEFLYTEYRIINPIYYAVLSEVILYREKIAESNKLQILNSWVGYSNEFLTKISKNNYRIKDIINYFRIEEFLQQFIVEGKRYGESIIPRNYALLRELKEKCGNPQKLEGWIQRTKDSIDLIKKSYEKKLENSKETNKVVNEVGLKIFRKYLERIDLK